MTEKQKYLVLSLLVLAAFTGMALTVYATTYGPGVGGDATIYLTSAKNLLQGQGLGWIEADGSFRLLPYTPPFYPLALSMVGLLVKDMAAGARWFNVLLYGLTVALVGWGFYRATGRPWLAAILGGLLATSPVLLGVQVWAMSEPLFLLVGFAGLLLVLAHLDRPRTASLVGAAALAGLAFLTRYFGVAFVLTGSLALLLVGRGARFSLRRPALREAFTFGLVACLPILVWLVIDFSQTGTVGSRSGQPAEAYWQRFLEIGPALQKIYLFWLLPDSVIGRLPGIVQTALWLVPLALLVALGVLLTRRASDETDRAGKPASAAAVRLAVIFGLFVLVYLAVLVVVQVFTYPPITLASRMLSPVHLAVLVLLFALLHLSLDRLVPGKRLALAAVYLVALALLGTYALRSLMIARDYHQTGIGYNSLAWRNSATIAAVRELPDHVALISNETTALMYLAGRPAYPLQEIYQDEPLETFEPYGAGSDESQRVFREENGALVLFYGTLHEDFAMYGERVDERLSALTGGLVQYFEGEDGAIYFQEQPSFLSSAP